MNADGIKELHTKLVCDNHCFLYHIQKDNGLIEIYTVQDPYQLGQLLFFTESDIIMGQVTGIHFFVLKLQYKWSFCLFHNGYAVFACLFGECRSKQEHLFGFGRISQQVLQVFQILVVINDSITLVNHKIFHVVSPDVVLGNQMSHSAQSSNYDMRSKILCFQLVFTIPKRQSSEVTCYPELRLCESYTQFSEFYKNLVGQLPCTDCHNAMVRKVLAIALWSEHVQYCKDIDCSFSCPRFRLTKHITVLVSYYLGYYFVLNLSRILKTNILDSNHELGFEFQITPFYESILPILYLLNGIWLYRFLVFMFLNIQYILLHLSPFTNDIFFVISKVNLDILIKQQISSQNYIFGKQFVYWKSYHSLPPR